MSPKRLITVLPIVALAGVAFAGEGFGNPYGFAVPNYSKRTRQRFPNCFGPARSTEALSLG